LPYVLSLARRLVRHAGWAVAAIDGPGHGDRADANPIPDRAPGAGLPEGFVGQVASATETMTSDWTAALGELRGLDEVGDGPLGYWGLSMGTMFGAPFVGATPTVGAAVLGLMGTFGEADPWTTAAADIACPVLFLVQTDDELIPVDRAVALFTSIGASDKRLHAHPGPHSAVPVEEMDASEAFLRAHLG
jgi:dienelactone hydrolase